MEQELEKIRLSLVNEEKERKRSEDAKKLADTAREIENILNEDFSKLMDELELARRIIARKSATVNEGSGGDGEILPGGGDTLSQWQQAGHPHSNGQVGQTPPGEGDEPRPSGPSLIPGNQVGAPKAVSDSQIKRKRGLFLIDFCHSTSDAKRSSFDSESRTIYINLDHPQIASLLRASGGSTDTRQFKEMAYEVAIVQYAQAVQYERMKQGHDLDAGEVLFDIEDVIDRLTKKVTNAMAGKF